MSNDPDFDAGFRALAAPPAHHRNDRRWRALGVVMLVAAVATSLVGYGISATTTDPLRQRDGLALGAVAVTVAIVGLALFLRYSLSGFLRFWLARLVIAQQVQPARQEVE